MILLIFMPLHWSIEIGFHWFGYFKGYIYFCGLYSLEIGLLIVTFFKLQSKMKKEHPYTYNLTKCWMNFFVISQCLSSLMVLIIDSLKYMKLLPHSLEQYHDYCQKHFEGELHFLFIKNFLVWTKSVSQLHLLLLSVGVIYVKNADDVLSSVNNLDKLLKVSRF